MTQQTLVFSREAVKPKVRDFALDNWLFKLENLGSVRTKGEVPCLVEVGTTSLTFGPPDLRPNIVCAFGILLWSKLSVTDHERPDSDPSDGGRPQAIGRFSEIVGRTDGRGKRTGA